MAQAINIFNFLKEYNLLSNPVVTELEKQKWNLELSDIPIINEIESVFHGHELDELVFLRVIKPVLEPCPKPDDSLLVWLDNDWQRLAVVDVLVKEKVSREEEDNEGNIVYVEEEFEDNEDRRKAYKDWIAQRVSWRELEIPREKGLNLYNKLFRLYSDMKKEAESVELIIGDGIINWKTDDRIIDHPVLLQKVNLEFDPEKPMFIINAEEIKTEIYSAMLRVLSSVNQKMLTDIMQDVEQQDYHLPDYENTFGLYQRLIHIIDEKGEFVEQISSTVHHAQIISSPVMFLRKRTLGYSAFLENIIAEINDKGESILPGFFYTMAGNHKEEQSYESINDDWNYSGIDNDILLTLPANNEQLKIIKYLDRYGAVLVQGPPGTGKTHTIANLIGHLLSQGNSVLVTSHTEKALTVLKDKVYKDEYNKDLNLQSLCISLLSSKSQKNEMDEAINEIASKGTTLDLHESEQKISNLKKERAALIDESQKKSQQLLEIRAMEYTDIVYNNETITPIEAAKYIKKGENTLNLIPGNTLDDSIGFPLSEEELYYLYKSNGTINADEEDLLGVRLPAFDSIWSVETFTTFVEKFKKLQKMKNEYKSEIEFNANLTIQDYEGLIDRANDLSRELSEFSDLQRYLLTKTIQDPVYPKLWEGVLENFDSLYREFDNIKILKFENDFKYEPNIVTDDSLAILKEIIDSGKETPVNKLSAIIKPKWNALRNAIQNDDKIIEKLYEYEAIQKIFTYEIDKKNLIKKLNKLLSETNIQIDKHDTMFEVKGAQQKASMQYAMNWYTSSWGVFINDYSDQLNNLNQWQEKNIIDLENPYAWFHKVIENEIIKDLEYAMNVMRLNSKMEELNEYFDFLHGYQNQNEMLDRLILSAETLSSDEYAVEYDVIGHILRKSDILQKRQAILDKINQVAPLWAVEIKSRKGVHGQEEPPEHIKEAWKWRQLVNQIERIDAYDPNKIQHDISQINELLLKNARVLAYESAWFEKIKNRTSRQAQAIEGWRTTIRQIGKGTGKRAPELMRKARELMPLCQTSIPVWIMPLTRVVENFDPRNNKFDVVIIDEASQSDILALGALYIGKKIIIVGDDEQVSPDSVGVKKNEVDSLIEMYLQGVPNSHLFNGQTSLYDMAKSSGFKPLMLTEHFRCLPEIIEFSNGLSYNGRIKPLRDSSKVNIKPPVIEYRVKNGYRNNKKVNAIEAMHIASIVCAMVEDQAYAGKTIGVISLLGTEQSYEVDRLLQMNLSPVEYENRRIQCGTPPQFQGDERDVIILSVVDSPNENGGPIRLLSEDGRNDMYRKRYNVAASRAKDQMWVVHSLNPEIDLKPDDIRLRLIKHAHNPSLTAEDARLKAAESPFEEEVMKALLNKGYKVIPQLKVGSYRIDMVVEDGDKRMAIECDGEKWHTQDDLPNDLKRQAILERLGWRFIRIRGSAYYRHPDEAMDGVFEQLNEYGIKPDFALTGDDNREVDEKAIRIIEAIKLRASELRREWNIDEEEIADYMENVSAAEEIHDNVIVENTINVMAVNHKSVKDINEVKVINPALQEQICIPGLEVDDHQISFADLEKREINDESVGESEKISFQENEMWTVPDNESEKINISEKVKDDNEAKPVFDFRNQDVQHEEKKNRSADKSQQSVSTNKKNVEDTQVPINQKKPMFDFRKK